VIVIQTNSLNQAGYPSNMVCPLTTQVQKASDILVDQIGGMDNTRLTTTLSSLSTSKILVLEDNLKKVLEL
jgi:mRNA-degrading endonuclease toxin of MazEF toxin-antitoxin module